LHADALAVDYSNAPESLFVGQSQILFDDRFDIARRDGVKIKDVGDLDLHRLRERVIGIDFTYTLICHLW